MARLQARARDGHPGRADRRSGRARPDHLGELHGDGGPGSARRPAVDAHGDGCVVRARRGARVARRRARCCSPVEQVADVVDRVDGTESDERVQLDPRDDELGRLATGVDHMLDRLDARRDEQRQLLQEVVHELRTPLAVATTNLELASTDPALQGETSTQVAAARRAIDRMGRTVDDLSAHGRLSLQGADTSTDIAKEAHALVAEHAAPASTRGLRIEVVAPPTRCP